MGDNGERWFDALFEAHYRDVLRYVLRRAPLASAEDVLAETFLVAWRRSEQIPDDPLPWLLGVARRVLANQRRGELRRDALLGRLRATWTGELGAWQPRVPSAASWPGRLRRCLIGSGRRCCSSPGRAWTSTRPPSRRAVARPRSGCAFTVLASGSLDSWQTRRLTHPSPERARTRYEAR